MQTRIKAACFPREKSLRAFDANANVGLLCLDELGYRELDRHGAVLLFQMSTEREEKNSVAITADADADHRSPNGQERPGRTVPRSAGGLALE